MNEWLTFGISSVAVFVSFLTMWKTNKTAKENAILNSKTIMENTLLQKEKELEMRKEEKIVEWKITLIQKVYAPIIKSYNNYSIHVQHHRQEEWERFDHDELLRLFAQEIRDRIYEYSHLVDPEIFKLVSKIDRNITGLSDYGADGDRDWWIYVTSDIVKLEKMVKESHKEMSSYLKKNYF